LSAAARFLGTVLVNKAGSVTEVRTPVTVPVPEVVAAPKALTCQL